MFAQEPGINTLDTPMNLPEGPLSTRPRICQWPIKINKIPSNAPYFHNAHLLIMADCVAYAYQNFHKQLNQNNVLVIGCPDLEIAEMTLKLTEILRQNDILSITVMRMDTPCCKQISQVIFLAVRNSGKDIPVRLTTVFTEGEIIE